jgi:hypothetical protein
VGVESGCGERMETIVTVLRAINLLSAAHYQKVKILL